MPDPSYTQQVREGVDDPTVPNGFDLQGVNVVQQVQKYYDQYGRLPANNEDFPVRLEDGRVVDGRSWWAKNNWWVVPALVAGGGIAAGAALGGGAAGAAGAGGAGAATGGGAAGAGGGILGAAGVSSTIPTIPFSAGSALATPIAGVGGATAAGAGGSSALGGVLGGIKKAGSVLGRVAPVLGEMAGSMGDSRVNANNSRLAVDRTRLDRANSMDRSIIDRAGVDLDQRQFQLDAPGKRLSTGVRGSLAANYTPTTVSSGAPMTMSSGAQVKPTMFSAPKLGQGAKDLGALVEQQMLSDQQAGDKFAPLPKVDFPEVRDPEEAGFLESAVNLGAGVAGVGGALANPTMDRLMRRYRSGGSQ